MNKFIKSVKANWNSFQFRTGKTIKLKQKFKKSSNELLRFQRDMEFLSAETTKLEILVIRMAHIKHKYWWQRCL